MSKDKVCRAYCLIRLEPGKEDSVRKYLNGLGLKNFSTCGYWDLLVEVSDKSMNKVKETTERKIKREGIMETETLLVLE